MRLGVPEIFRTGPPEGWPIAPGTLYGYSIDGLGNYASDKG